MPKTLSDYALIGAMALGVLMIVLALIVYVQNHT